MFRKLLDQAETGDNIGALSERRTERRDRKRTGTVQQPGTIHPHTKFKGRGIRTEEGRRRKTHTVLQRIQTAVLFQNNRRNRRSAASGRNRDVHAWRQHHDDDRA